jgi:hypothetical protein
MAKRKGTDDGNKSLNDPPRRSTRQKITQFEDRNNKPTDSREQQKSSSKKTSSKTKIQKATESKQEDDTHIDKKDAG